MQVVFAFLSSAELDAISHICSEGSLEIIIIIAIAFPLFYLYKAYNPKKVCNPKVESPWTKFNPHTPRETPRRRPISNVRDSLISNRESAASLPSLLKSSSRPQISAQLLEESEALSIINSICALDFARQAEEGVALFKTMCDKDLDVAMATECNSLQFKRTAINFYIRLLKCYLHLETPNPDAIFELLQNMRSRSHVEPTLEFYEAAMRIFAGKKQYHHALAMHKEMIADGIEPRVVTLDCLVFFAKEVSNLTIARDCFDQLMQITTPSMRVCMVLLQLYAAHKDMEATENLMERMKTIGADLNNLTFNVALTTFVQNGCVEKVPQLVERYATSTNMDVVSYNVLLKCFAKSRNAKGALTQLEAMLKSEIKPDLISYNTALDAVVRSRDAAMISPVLTMMLDAHVQPDKWTMSALKNLLSRSQDLPVEVIQQVQQLTSNLPASDPRAMQFRHTFASVLMDSAQDS